MTQFTAVVIYTHVWSWYTGARGDTTTAMVDRGKSHRAQRRERRAPRNNIFLSSLIDPLRLKERLLLPQGMDFSLQVSPEIESSKFAEVQRGSDSPKPCLLLSYKEQAWTQHAEVQMQPIS